MHIGIVNWLPPLSFKRFHCVTKSTLIILKWFNSVENKQKVSSQFIDTKPSLRLRQKGTSFSHFWRRLFSFSAWLHRSFGHTIFTLYVKKVSRLTPLKRRLGEDKVVFGPLDISQRKGPFSTLVSLAIFPAVTGFLRLIQLFVHCLKSNFHRQK